MATKQNLKALKDAKEAADKAYLAALEAGRKEAIGEIHASFKEHELTAIDLAPLITSKDEAIELLVNIVGKLEILPADLGFAAPAEEKKGKGRSGPRGEISASFKKDGKDIKWPPAGKTVPADVKEVLSIWEAGKPIKEYVLSDDHKKRISLVVRIEKATKKGTKAQLDDLGVTREEIDKKAAA
ncbi:hypothetical protein [Paraburkholderia aromaticivorans]|uniref:hypothetical protein n=1 Tax=Paraburkholderia aromaticivorans TaxID=2026199 RepID=UPI0038B888B4